MPTVFQSCAHTHTTYCDGKSTAEEMVLRAIELGFVSLGFTSHGYAPYDVTAMPRKDEYKYRDEILALQKKYEGQLEILLGQEHDYLMPYDPYPYEYLIESAHHVYHVRDLYGTDISAQETMRAIEAYGDPYEYCRCYFRDLAEAYCCSKAQIAGHIDIVAKFNEQVPMFDENDPRYLIPAMEALECAVERGLVIEVNTGAIARGYRTTPYPRPVFLKRLKELNGQVMINSDCHNADFLTCHYAESVELLKSCGFDHCLILRKHGFEEVGL